MKLFLVRHGEYVPETVDPEKSLSEKGKEDIHKLGEKLKSQGFLVDIIYHSTKKRAEQTAQIISKDILTGNRISAEEGLNPDDDIKPWVEKIQNVEVGENLMIVGHLPFMEKLVAYLLTQDENKAIVEFFEGTTVILEKNADGKWIIEKTVNVNR